MKCKIEEIRDGNVYQGRAYAQYICVLLRNNKQMLIYDIDKQCKPSLVGKCVQVDVKCDFIGDFEIIKENEKFIVPKETSVSNGIIELSGEVVDVNNSREIATVNVGIGNIKMSIKEDCIDSLSSGDFVRASDISDTYLLSISGITS